MNIGKIACLVVLCMAVVLPRHAEALTCYQVTYSLIGCLSYITNTGHLDSCCHGVRSLHSSAVTRSDRQTACTCMQFAARAIPGIDWDKANSLPGICEVDYQEEINPSTDCSM
ncbi:hypothetical protein RND71_031212 [Anisodus tanguticus]|uniref:Non-specific lipid-transfer protein n=1 Tax=Anisodus tanguticus TaxID=243964 RepID=A0AAE1UYP2_9SOLA|nr:hypothetical protein RND71_031212 [Anisodus tanguticus]